MSDDPRQFLSMPEEAQHMVLVCTNTLAWGVNLPGHHLFIIEGTEYYDGKTKRYVDFPISITDISQMMLLRFYKKDERYSRESQVGQSTVSQVTWRFIEALEERAKHHLKWPDSNRMEEIKSKLEEAFGLPNCCGAIDGTHHYDPSYRSNIRRLV
ncbi:unnamed protein product [Prunus armeniaca]